MDQLTYKLNMRSRNFFIVMLILIIAGCQTDNSTVITYKLSQQDFSEKIFGIGTLQSANNNVITTPRISSNAIKIIELGEEGIIVAPGDTLCILEANDLVQQFDQQNEQLDRLKANLIKLEASNAVEQALLQASLDEFKAQKRLSVLDSIQLLYSPKNKSEIKILEEKINDIQQKKVIRKMEAQNKINEQSARALNSQIIQKKQRIRVFQDQLDQLILKAPSSGLLVHASLPMHTIISSTGEMSTSGGGKITKGSSVNSRMPLIQLPDLDSMQIILMLQEAEYKRVQKGQKVFIQSEAQPDLNTIGTVKNKTLSSSPLAYRYKVKSYKIIIDIDSLDNLFLPGLSASCEIVIQEEEDVIIAPSIAIFEKDSSKNIYVERNGMFEIQAIETGKSNPSETIITKGLLGGETIALLEPPINQIRKTEKSKNE